MKILSRVCAEFCDKNGNPIYRITPADRLVYKDDAPETIRGDLLFRMLVADGSIDVIETVEQRKKLESDPTEGTTADGKKAAEQAKTAKSAKTAKAEKTEAEAADPAKADQTEPEQKK